MNTQILIKTSIFFFFFVLTENIHIQYKGEIKVLPPEGRKNINTTTKLTYSKLKKPKKWETNEGKWPRKTNIISSTNNSEPKGPTSQDPNPSLALPT